MLDKKTAGTHAKVRYRCFLPDLAGFTSPRCPDHKTPFGERRIRTHGTVPGTPDFESGAFDHSASSPPIHFSAPFNPELPEEVHHQFAAFVGQHTSGNGQPMVVASFIDEVVQRAGRYPRCAGR